MERLVRYFVGRPLLVHLAVLAVVGFGLARLLTIQKEGFPSVSHNRVVITTEYPGASAKDVEYNVTVPIEQELREVGGIKEVRSISQEGMSIVTVEADDSATEREFAVIYDDIEAAVSRTDDLPDDLDGRPILRRVTSDDRPVIEVALSGPPETLRSFSLKVENAVRPLPGVSNVEIVGLPDDEIHILVDPVKAQRWHIDLRAIARAVGERNLEGSGGTIESFVGERKVVLYSKFRRPEDVLKTNIRRSPEGQGVRLEDVASIKESFENRRLVVRNLAGPGVSLLVKKMPRSDIVRTVGKVKEVVAALSPPAGVKVEFLNDQSQLTRERLKLLVVNAGIGFLLIVAILWAALGPRTAFWTAFGIPFSMLSLLIVMPWVGITLNAVSLGFSVMILGLLVDDAIVTAENVHAAREEGLGPLDAAAQGVGRIWRPVLAATATTVVAYSPIARLGGLPGKFVWAAPVIVGVVLAASLIDSYFFLPAHLSHGKGRLPGKGRLMLGLEKLYGAVLDAVLKRRYVLLVVFGMMFVGSVGVGKKFLKKNPFPQEAADGFIIRATLPVGTQEQETVEALAPLERALTGLPRSELGGFTLRIGTHSTDPETDRGTQANIATFFVYLTPYSDRERTAQMILDAVRAKAGPELAATDVGLTAELMRIGPPLGRAFEIRVSSLVDENRRAVVRDIQDFLGGVPGVSDLENDDIPGKPELDLDFDYDRLAAAGLTISDILATLRIAFDGQVVTDMIRNGARVDFRLRLNEPARADIGWLSRIPVLNSRGKLIPLGSLMAVGEKPAVAEIRHVGGERTTTVYGEADKNVISPTEIVRRVSKRFPSADGLRISFAGEPVENEKIFRDIGVAAASALLGIFLVIALVLDSFGKPLLVLAAVPFGLIGVVAALLLHGLPVSLFVSIGVIGIMGIAVNDSIVMVYTMGDIADDGDVLKRIRTVAVSRLRPIVLTTVTTVVGLGPTAYALGGYDPFITPLCLTMAWGLPMSTLGVLLALPALYAVGVDFRAGLSRFLGRTDAAQKEA